MDIKKIILLAGALIVAGITAFMARGMFANSNAPQANAQIAQQQQGVEVLVAVRTMPVGTIVDPSAFRYQPWPKDMVDAGYFAKDAAENPQSLAGTVVRYAVPAGQPVTRSALVKPGDRGFLAAALGPGMRAVTVPISATSGVAGFVFPGDRVDLVLTQDVAGGGDGQPLKASETIIRNLRVLAVDQTMDKTPKEGEDVNVRPASTATLEVTPKMAEKIAVAQNIGALTLSLRSLADNTADLEAAIASGEVNVPENGDPKAEKQMLLAIAAMPNDRGTSATTGGEVSRFQRTSVPGRSGTGGSPEEEEARRLQAQLQVRQLRAKASPAVVIRRGGTVADN
jgi:pilus assembly protein CpaB